MCVCVNIVKMRLWGLSWNGPIVYSTLSLRLSGMIFIAKWSNRLLNSIIDIVHLDLHIACFMWVKNHEILVLLNHLSAISKMDGFQVVWKTNIFHPCLRSFRVNQVCIYRDLVTCRTRWTISIIKLRSRVDHLTIRISSHNLILSWYTHIYENIKKTRINMLFLRAYSLF